MTFEKRTYWRAATIAATFTLILSQSAPAADAPEWTLDAAKSSIAFTGRQMNVPSTGKFKTFKAIVKFDPDDLAASSVEVTVDAASADSGNPDIDKELKQEKWFDVARYPTVRFVTSALRPSQTNGAAKGEYEAVARLTIRDVTQDVVLPFRLDVSADPADPGMLLARVVGEMKISRTKFGVGRDEWRDTGIVADEVGLKIDVVARRKK